MTSPEFEPAPDTTPQFQQAYGVDRGNDENVRNVIVEFIEGNETLTTALRGHLQTDMPFEDALSLTLAEANDLGIIEGLQDVIDRQLEADSEQRETARVQVGLRFSTEISHPEIDDIAKFTTALQNARLPEDPEATDMLRKDLAETIGYCLYTTAIAARDVPPATIAEPPGPKRPKVLADVGYLDEEELQQIRDERHPGSEALETTITESGRLAQAIEDLGLPDAHSRGFRHLEIAAREGVVREWAAAHDTALYSIMPVCEVGDMFSGRYGTDSEREQAVTTIRHLQETIPGTELAQETARALLDDVQTFMDTPFDPEAGEPVTQLDVYYHDRDHGRTPEAPEDDTPDASDATESEEPTPEDPDDIEHLFKDFGVIIIEEERDLPDEWPQVPELELASPEDSRRVKQEMHEEMVIGLTDMRDQILAVLPPDEQRRFRLKQASSAMERVQAARAEGASASVGDIAAIIVGQETALETVTAYLAEAGESVINAQATIERTLGDASSPDAITAINAVATALESLKKGREHIIDGLTHFKRYNP